jgi:hypothetical protein
VEKVVWKIKIGKMQHPRMEPLSVEIQLTKCQGEYFRLFNTSRTIICANGFISIAPVLEK